MFDWPIVLQHDVKAKLTGYRLISRKFSGLKFFHPNVCLTNQKPRDKPTANKSFYLRFRFCFVRAFTFQGHTKIPLFAKMYLKRSFNHLQDGRVYMVDYKILEDIPHYGQNREDLERRYMCASLGLFYVKGSGDLVPIAIQFHQQPSDDNPIWTPNDSKLDWLCAKFWLRNSDTQFHQVKSLRGAAKHSKRS